MSEPKVSRTRSSPGFGASIRIRSHRIQINLGMSFPTGSDHNLANNHPAERNLVRRVEPSTPCRPGPEPSTSCRDTLWRRAQGPWSWGLSYRARLPLGVNPEGYMWGNYQEAERLGRL